MNHLHCHSHYSILDGLGRVEHIVTRAKVIGATAVAITDHASITAMPELFKHAKAAGIKPIIGCEFYVTPTVEGAKDEVRSHLTVLAKSWTGVKSLMSMLTLANEQFYRRPRITFDQALEFKGCVIMTACSGGMLANDEWKSSVSSLSAAYGDDLYAEIMPHVVIYDKVGIDRMEVINRRAIEAHETMGIKLVATNDAHYVNREDAHTHEILLAIQTGAKWNDPKRWSWGCDDFYMRDLNQMVEAFRKNCPYISDEILGAALRATVEIADKINIEMPKFDVHLPSIHDNDDAAFSRLISEGWNSKLGVTPSAEYRDRLLYEINVVSKLGFVKYFLMVEDIIRTARAKGIMVGPARGSAAGSLICYLMDITQVDPIKHGLFFERFLNPERIDLPDIDVDFEDTRRAEVFDYIRRKYGAEYTANISTVGVLSAPSAFRDVARVFGAEHLTINQLSKQIEDEESFDKEPDLIKFVNASKENVQIVEQAKKLIGTIRSNGVHPCGFLISSERLKSVSVIEHRKDSSVVNWDMRLCESFGLLKVDILGLSTLTVLNMARKLVKEHRGVDIEFTKIPLDDKGTLEAFSRGEGAGIFQFENSGMQALLKALHADNFETITDTTALFRPGSLESGETERYVQVAQGYRYEQYVCPQLEPILKPTRGFMVYQEQIMQIFNQLGGFSWAEADKMRKIIGKKLGAEEFEKHRDHFVTGCAASRIEKAIAEGLFTKMVEFAKYSFNKSHAVAYTMISFWTMFVKVHYPVEFFAAHLTHRHDEKVLEIVRDARRMGVEISRPDINRSTSVYEISDTPNTILAPLTVIKGIGAKCVEAILDARAKQAFLSEDDFKKRINARACNKRHLELLKRAGAFESLGIREPSQAVREKDYAELLSIFDTLPTIDNGAPKLDRDGINELYQDVQFCAKKAHKLVMLPSSGAKPFIMVINTPVKSEKEHLTNEATKGFLDVVKAQGISPSAIYYTGNVKCRHGFEAATSECLGTCADFLRREIKLVAPKLIICFATTALGMLTSEKKPSMAKLSGKVVYNKEFDCYVLFSYSPQYAFYAPDKAETQFLEAMGKLKEIFNGEDLS